MKILKSFSVHFNSYACRWSVESGAVGLSSATLLPVQNLGRKRDSRRKCTQWLSAVCCASIFATPSETLNHPCVLLHLHPRPGLLLPVVNESGLEVVNGRVGCNGMVSKHTVLTKIAFTKGLKSFSSTQTYSLNRWYLHIWRLVHSLPGVCSVSPRRISPATGWTDKTPILHSWAWTLDFQPFGMIQCWKSCLKYGQLIIWL